MQGAEIEGIAGPEHTVVVREDRAPRDTGAWRKKRPAAPKWQVRINAETSGFGLNPDFTNGRRGGC